MGSRFVWECGGVAQLFLLALQTFVFGLAHLPSTVDDSYSECLDTENKCYAEDSKDF
jgi:hypothetical protein